MAARTGTVGVVINGASSAQRLHPDYAWYDAANPDLSPDAIVGPPPILAVGGPGDGPNLLEWQESGFPSGSEQSKITYSGALPPGVTLVHKEVREESPPGFNPWPVGVLAEWGWAGVPTTPGVYNVTVDPSSHAGSAGYPGEDFTWTISLADGCPLISVEPDALPATWSIGAPVSIQFTAEDGVAPYVWDVAAGALPDGVTLSSDGLLSGTPTTLGAFTFTIRATDDNGCPGVTAYTLSVVEAPPITLAPTTLADGARRIYYLRLLVASGGIGAPYTFDLLSGALPPGLSLSPGGLLAGMPTLPGAYSFTVRATDGAANTGDQAYTLTIRGLRIDIAGVDHLDDIAQADFELGLNQRSRATLVLGDDYIPDRLAEVVLYARDGVTAIFDGLILSRDTRGQVAGHPANAVVAECVDFSIYFDNTSVTLSYAGPVSVEAVIADIHYQALEEYGLTYTPVPTGLTLEPFAWVDVVVADAFKQISDKTGVVIRMIPLKEIRAFLPGSDEAPVTITDGTINAFDLTWKDGGRLTPNTVELLCGPSGPGQVGQQWIADGIASSWVTDLPAIDPPPILVEIDDGVSPYLATVVPAGSGGGMYEWDRDTHTLSLGTDPLPAAGTTITLGPTEHFNSPFTYYTVQFPFKVRETTGATPLITYRESRPDLVEYRAARQVAQGILDRESFERRDLEIVTDVDGFLPGQAVTVNTTARGGIDGDFPVTSVRGHIVNAEHWEYGLTAQQAAAYQGSYVDQWKALTSGGAVGSASPAPVAAPVGGGLVGPGAAVDGEGVLFDGTTGNLLKRATGTGVVHRISGVDAVSGVVEADLALDDNTTADVSTEKHGFVPKAPGDPAYFLNGDDPPAWAVPPGSGGIAGALVLLETRSAAAGADITCSARNATGQSGATFQSDFDEYVIVGAGLFPSTNGAHLDMQIGTGATPTWSAGTNYQFASQGLSTAGAGVNDSGAGAAAARVLKAMSNSGTLAGQLSIMWSSLLSTALLKPFSGTAFFYNTSPASVQSHVGGVWTVSGTAATAVRFVPSAGNITGTIKVYGIAK